MKKTKKISYAPLSGASVISDPDRHPYLVQLCDIITKRGGKYMDKSIECAKREYNERYYDPDKSMGQWLYVHYDASTWDFILQEYRKTVKDFNKTKRSNVTHLLRNAKLAAKADIYHCILKNRLFWNEIIMLKLKSAPLSGTSTDSEKIIQNLTQKIWKEGINSITLEQLNNLIKDIQNGRTETYNTRRLGQIAARLFKDDDNRGVVGGYHRPGSAGDALVAAAIISGSSAGIDKCPLGYFREKLIERWAQENGCWIDDIEKYAHQQSWTRASELDGEESIIYITSHNTVVKIWSMIKYNENLQLAVDKIILHNFVFGDGTFLKVKGFTKINYRLRFILEQPKIEHEDETNNGIAIREHLKEKFPGRDIDKQKGQYIVHLPGFSIYDLHGGNVVRSKNGNFYVIDCNIRYVKENPTPWYLRGLEGTEHPFPPLSGNAPYSGNGGRKDTTERGILDEYYTPDFVCEFMYALAVKYGYKAGKVLEPSCATGNIIRPIYERNDYTHIDAFEINKTSRDICQKLFPNVTIYDNYFETAFLEPPRYSTKAKRPWLKNAPYDLAIGNPPYGKHVNRYSSYFSGKDKFAQIEMFFMYKCLDLLRSGGLLVFITSNNFMSTGNAYQGAKERIGEIADLVDAYRLPKVFERTDICTDIIVLRKK